MKLVTKDWGAAADAVCNSTTASAAIATETNIALFKAMPIIYPLPVHSTLFSVLLEDRLGAPSASPISSMKSYETISDIMSTNIVNIIGSSMSVMNGVIMLKDIRLNMLVMKDDVADTMLVLLRNEFGSSIDCTVAAGDACSMKYSKIGNIR